MIRFVSQPSERPEPAVDSPPPAVARAPLVRRLHDVDPPYLEGLNDEQRRAVESLDGPVLILAGAGVGKTRVLTTRIAHIVFTGRARAHEILAVTFTNKAAREMRQRVAVFSGSEQAMPWLGTFHSVGAKILRMHAELVGLRPNFTILDTDDQLRLLKQLLRAENLDDKRWPARALANLIDGWKNRGVDPKSVPVSEAAGFAGGKSAALYESYQARLKALNAVDFGDLLLEPLRLLREHSDVLNTFRRRFRYILVDEYQDTNVVQYLLLRLIAEANGNLCCVGDDDQSIYAWRGADVENILRFEKDFPGAKVIRLERNYRSTGHILAVAAGLIAHNRGRLGKTLFTDKPLGDRPRVAEGSDSQEEASSSARRSKRPSTKAFLLTTSPSWFAPPFRCANSRSGSSPWGCLTRSSAARDSTSGRKYATPWPIFAASPNPTTTSPSSVSITSPNGALAKRRCDPARLWPASRSIADPRGAGARRNRGTETASASNSAGRPRRLRSVAETVGSDPS